MYPLTCGTFVSVELNGLNVYKREITWLAVNCLYSCAKVLTSNDMTQAYKYPTNKRTKITQHQIRQALVTK